MDKYIPTCCFCGTTCKKDKTTGEYMTDKPCPKCGHSEWKVKDCADLFGSSTIHILQRLKREGAITDKEFEKLRNATARKKSGPKKGKVIDMSLIKKATEEVAKVENTDDEGKEWNALCQQHIFNIASIKKPILSSRESIQRAVEDYFKLVQKDGMKPSVSGLAMAIGVSRSTLLSWANGETQVQNQEVIQKALQMLETFDEIALLDSTNAKTNPVALMFHMKNNHGYTDKTNIVVGSNNSDLSDKEIAEKHAKELDIIDADFTEK